MAGLMAAHLRAAIGITVFQGVPPNIGVCPSRRDGARISIRIINAGFGPGGEERGGSGQFSFRVRSAALLGFQAHELAHDLQRNSLRTFEIQPFNTYGIVYLHADQLETMVIGYPSPLLFERELNLSVKVHENGIVQMLANSWRIAVLEHSPNPGSNSTVCQAAPCIKANSGGFKP